MEKAFSQTIVLVDDETELLELYQLRLKPLNCSFLAFSKPQDFIQHLKSNPAFTPDLLITDFMMPGLDGIQMVREAAKLRKIIPSILISGYIDKEKAITATNSGIWHLLEKPADKDHLISLAQKILLESRIRRLGSEIRVVMTQLAEMFTAFRLLYKDSAASELLSKPLVVSSPGKPGDALTFEQSLDDLEEKLQALSEEEAKISQAITK